MTTFPGARREQGGQQITIPSGSSIVIENGGIIDLKTGAIFRSNGTQAALLADLGATVGTADGTVADVGGAFNQTTLNNNFRDVVAHINSILAVLKNAGIMASS
jgi:hypothetical protein